LTIKVYSKFNMKLNLIIPVCTTLVLITSGLPQGGYDVQPASPSQTYGPPGHTPGSPMGPSEYSSNSNDFSASESTTSTCTDKSQNPQQNKANVIKFYEELFGKKNFAAIDEYIGPMYIQHNPMTLSGKDKLLESLNGPFWQRLTGYKIFRLIAEDDFVWVHDRMDFGDTSYVFIDILRFECGKIVEHWDAIQKIDPNAINPLAYF